MSWTTVRLTNYLGEQAYLKRVTLALEGESAIVRCGYCYGRGIDSWGGCKCHICHGEGKNRVRAPLARCAFCMGRGRPFRGMAISCEVCGGRGVLTLPEPSERCVACAGVGHTVARYACTRCGGRGFSG